jgi:cyclomaltodextrinase / maltogenic alpha-amylase / neopullulanase
MVTENPTSARRSPAWTGTAIFWHAYPLGFCGAPIRDHAEALAPGPDGRVAPVLAPVHHRLPRLTRWLDHLLSLGANGLLLGPVHASATHGYDSLDLLRTDPRLGDEADTDALLAGCRERGIRVVLDGVFNHVGDQHPLFRAALAEGPGSPADAMFRIDRSDPADPTWDTYQGHRELPALNHDSPAVVELVVETMCHWLGRGVDGWRLDAAFEVPAAFWAQVLPRVRERFPDAWILGEMIGGDYAAMVRDGTLDSVTQYELFQAAWHAPADGNLFELAHALGRHAAFLADFRPQTFVGNHDVTRIASQDGIGTAVLALVTVLAVGGVPSIYAGDEFGLTGVKANRLGGDDVLRPEFPADPAAAAEAPGAAAMLDLHRQLIALRRQRPWLVDGVPEVLVVQNDFLRFAVRGPSGSGTLVVDLDITETSRARLYDAPDGAAAEALAAGERLSGIWSWSAQP